MDRAPPRRPGGLRRASGRVHKGDARPFVLKRHYEHVVSARHVLVVDDVVNTGYSLRGAVAAVRAAGGEVVVVAAVVDRGGAVADDVDVPALLALAEYALESWPPEACPLCRGGRPVNVEYAHGRQFVDGR